MPFTVTFTRHVRSPRSAAATTAPRASPSTVPPNYVRRRRLHKLSSLFKCFPCIFLSVSDSGPVPVTHPPSHLDPVDHPLCRCISPASTAPDSTDLFHQPTNISSISCPSSTIAPSHDECSPATSVSATTTLEPAGSIETIPNRSPADSKQPRRQLPPTVTPTLNSQEKHDHRESDCSAINAQTDSSRPIQTRSTQNSSQNGATDQAQSRREMPCLRFNVKDDIFFSLDLPYLTNSNSPFARPSSDVPVTTNNIRRHDSSNDTPIPPNADHGIHNSSQATSHLNYQNSAYNTQSATGRSFAHNSEVITLAATRQNSVQLHDYNTNTVLLITLNDSSSSSSASSHRTIRDGNSTASESVAHDSDADDSDDEHSHVSELTPSEVSSDEDNIQTLIKRLQVSPTSHMIASALDQCKTLILPPHQQDALMQALNGALQAVDSNTNAHVLHPDLRAEVHHVLAQHFLTKGYSSRQQSLHHCNSGLLFLHGRERLFPRLAADLHLLAANILLGRRAQHPMQEIFTHIRAARIALLTCQDMDNVDAHVKLFVTKGFAHSVCTTAPVCEHLLAGFDAYMSAIEMVRLGADSTSTPWMHLTCVAAQLALRFLRHRRHALEDPKSPCWSTTTAACHVGATTRLPSTAPESERNAGLCSNTNIKKARGMPDCTLRSTSRPDVRKVEIDDVLQMVDDVRRKLTAMLDAGSDGEIYDLELRLSVAHECVGRCYVERSYGVHGSCGGRSIVDDLKKGCSALQNALRSCEWSDEYAGQRYVSLSELLEESRRRLSEAELEERLRVKSEEDELDADYVDEWDDSLWDEIDIRKQDNRPGRDSVGCEGHGSGSGEKSTKDSITDKENDAVSRCEESEVRAKRIETKSG